MLKVTPKDFSKGSPGDFRRNSSPNPGDNFLCNSGDNSSCTFSWWFRWNVLPENHSKSASRSFLEIPTKISLLWFKSKFPPEITVIIINFFGLFPLIFHSRISLIVFLIKFQSNFFEQFPRKVHTRRIQRTLSSKSEWNCKKQKFQTGKIKKLIFQHFHQFYTRFNIAIGWKKNLSSKSVFQKWHHAIQITVPCQQIFILAISPKLEYDFIIYEIISPINNQNWK